MTLLLITGAGASRDLGKDKPMPLMPDWSNALCAALDEQEASLARSCHLVPGMDGPEFEKNLGLLIRYEQTRHLEERFQDLGGQEAGSHINYVVKARRNITKRMQTVMKTINVSLYEQFNQRKIDEDKAAAAFQGLLGKLNEPDIIFATTNYDRVGETALESIGRDIDDGFRRRPGLTPVLDPVGLVDNRGSKVPVIHLHGAVGWYEIDNAVSDHNADRDFNPSLGRPVVLYPDPDKDPTSDATVQQLWHEFDTAIKVADAVMVIGHSLHDPKLVKALATAAESKPVVISFATDADASRIEAEVPKAASVELIFGPEIEIDTPDLSSLLGSAVGAP